MILRNLTLGATVTAAALMTMPGVVAKARAEIYRYEQPDGTVVFSTTPQPGMRPTAVYGEGRRAPGRSATGTAAPQGNGHDRFDGIIREAADRYQLPFAFVKAVIRVESGFNPDAVSPVGAQGLMQLMPATAAELQCEDPFDPRQNIMAGTQFLRMLANRYNGDINLVLAAYNAGPGAVSRFEGIPFEETRVYVERVYSFYQEYLAAERRP
jgi:soluble lytic murein transglycosylase-like protein